MHLITQFCRGSSNVMKWVENVTDVLNGFCLTEFNVYVNNCLSDWLPITEGVPQGSVVGSFYFSCSYLRYASSSFKIKGVTLHPNFGLTLNFEDSQSDLTNISSWYCLVTSISNSDKTIIISFERLEMLVIFVSTFTISFKAEPSDEYLGAIVDSNMKIFQ